MFDRMTTEAARIERMLMLARVEARSALVPDRPGPWARLVARMRPTADQAAPVVHLAGQPEATTSVAA